VSVRFAVINRKNFFTIANHSADIPLNFFIDTVVSVNGVAYFMNATSDFFAGASYSPNAASNSFASASYSLTAASDFFADALHYLNAALDSVVTVLSYVTVCSLSLMIDADFRTACTHFGDVCYDFEVIRLDFETARPLSRAVFWRTKRSCISLSPRFHSLGPSSPPFTPEVKAFRRPNARMGRPYVF
jgi:hypothetical protein